MAAATSTSTTTTQNSTIVRAPKKPIPLQLRAARAGFAIVSPRAPDLAARWAEEMFLTARRRKRPPWEAEALARATRTTVPYAGGVLPVWTWTPGVGAAARTDQPATVLLVHGWEGRGAQLASLVDPLLERGLRVVTFDAPGHGESTLRLGSVVEHARAVVEVARTIGDVHAVIGHSVGGTAALLATRWGFRAKRFVLLGAPRTPLRFLRGFSKFLRLDERTRDAMIARIEARYGIRFADLDVRADAQRLEEPLLVVHDDEDDVVPVLEGVALASSAKDGRLIPTTGLGHYKALRSPSVIADIVAFAAEGVRVPTLEETIDGELFYRDTRW